LAFFHFAHQLSSTTTVTTITTAVAAAIACFAVPIAAATVAEQSSRKNEKPFNRAPIRAIFAVLCCPNRLFRKVSIAAYPHKNTPQLTQATCQNFLPILFIVNYDFSACWNRQFVDFVAPARSVLCRLSLTGNLHPKPPTQLSFHLRPIILAHPEFN
jgi:hypothetical protein